MPQTRFIWIAALFADCLKKRLDAALQIISSHTGLRKQRCICQIHVCLLPRLRLRLDLMIAVIFAKLSRKAWVSLLCPIEKQGTANFLNFTIRFRNHAILMKSCAARWNSRFAWMKVLAFGFRWTRVFAHGEDTYACRLRASSTRSARGMRTQSLQGKELCSKRRFRHQ